MIGQDSHDDLFDLLDALREERLSPDEAARLEVLVRNHAEARQTYVQYMQLVSSLHWCHSDPPGLDFLSSDETNGSPRASDPAAPPARLPDLQAAPTPPDSPSIIPRVIRTLPWVDAAPLFIGGCLLLAIGIVLGMRLNRDPAPAVASAEVAQATPGESASPALTGRPDAAPAKADSSPFPAPVARLLRTVDCKWEGSTLPTEVGSPLVPGKLRLTQGTALIAFESGAEVLLTGPATFELNSPMAATLSLGRIVARVTSAAHGFAIHTPSAVVVDLGTEFGVLADAQGATEVHVFEGSVELHAATGDGNAAHDAAPPVRLAAGAARRLESRRDASQPLAEWTAVPLDEQRFARSLESRASPQTRQSSALLSDDFTDPQLDPDRWRVVRDGVPGRPDVRVAGGRVELVNRGYLVTRQQFDPAAVGGLRIRGRFRLVSPEDTLQILTRSDAEPMSDSYGDTRTGVEFFVNTQAGGVIGIYGRGEARLQEKFAVMNIEVGDTFDFEITDDGFDLSFTVRKLGGDGASARVEGTCNAELPSNFVVFHNRERTRIDRTAFLESITIETLAAAEEPVDDASRRDDSMSR